MKKDGSIGRPKTNSNLSTFPDRHILVVGAQFIDVGFDNPPKRPHACMYAREWDQPGQVTDIGVVKSQTAVSEQHVEREGEGDNENSSSDNPGRRTGSAVARCP